MHIKSELFYIEQKWSKKYTTSDCYSEETTMQAALSLIYAVTEDWFNEHTQKMTTILALKLWEIDQIQKCGDTDTTLLTIC